MFVTEAAEDLGSLTADELERELAAQAAHVDAGVCRLLELVAECERRLPLALEGGWTFPTWLAYRCSLSPGQAREYQRVAARLQERPSIHESFSRGELSFAKTSTLTRIEGPVDEPELLRLAEALSTSQLERAVGAYRRVDREQAREQQEQEFFTYHRGEDGTLSLRARLTADDGTTVLRALEAGRKALREQRVEALEPPLDADGAPARPFECRVTNAEALVAMADLALAHPDGDRTGGDRTQLIVHVDASTLAADAPGRCELDTGAPIAVETARRLACDASIVALVERDGQALALGRKRRTISPALRRALTTRDRGCRFPGCTSTRFVDAHHVDHWAHGGETNLENLVSLCRRHHRLVHERGYSVRLDDDGETHFTDQYGIAVPNVPRSPPSHPDALRDQHARRGLAIDDGTCRYGTGDPLDLGLTVDALVAITSETPAPEVSQSL
jgi:hypothetical protein